MIRLLSCRAVFPFLGLTTTIVPVQRFKSETHRGLTVQHFGSKLNHFSKPFYCDDSNWVLVVIFCILCVSSSYEVTTFCVFKHPF